MGIVTDDIKTMLGGLATKKLCDYVIDDLVPPLGIEHLYPTIFGRYGYTKGGIGLGWKWYENEVRKAPVDDLILMIAVANTYWLNYNKRKDH